jgi:hypothetical protein
MPFFQLKKFLNVPNAKNTMAAFYLHTDKFFHANFDESGRIIVKLLKEPESPEIEHQTETLLVDNLLHLHIESPTSQSSSDQPVTLSSEHEKTLDSDLSLLEHRLLFDLKIIQKLQAKDKEKVHVDFKSEQKRYVTIANDVCVIFY